MKLFSVDGPCFLTELVPFFLLHSFLFYGYVVGQDGTSSNEFFSGSMTKVLLRCNVPQHNHAVLVARWSSNSTHFWIELQAQTAGWMAFGVSPDGQMDGSDVLFGWCNDIGQCYAQDRSLAVDQQRQRVNLTSDINQDWTLLSGYENDTHTVITAARRLRTGHLNNLPITQTIMAIYAVGNFDPDVMTGEVEKHAYRGSGLLTVLPPTSSGEFEPVTFPMQPVRPYTTDNSLVQNGFSDHEGSSSVVATAVDYVDNSFSHESSGTQSGWGSAGSGFMSKVTPAPVRNPRPSTIRVCPDTFQFQQGNVAAERSAVDSSAGAVESTNTMSETSIADLIIRALNGLAGLVTWFTTMPGNAMR